MNIVELNKIAFGNKDDIVLIAGPCVIESKEQALEIGRLTKDIADSLGIPYVFKASYDKANRSSYNSFRGPGLKEGLRILAEIKEELKVPVVSDVHGTDQIEEAAKVLDIIQIPAFLCRQTDIVFSAAKTGKVINVKKGQFMAPLDMKNVVDKIREAENENILLTERGASFGYNNLVVDYRSFAIMRSFGYPIIFDGTHSVQLPGGAGTCSSGQREFVPYLSRAAAAVGIDGLFLEVHTDPPTAKSDGANMLYLDDLKQLLKDVLEINNVAKKYK
ncbi:3-deoxy-8-phosphooctulonate synthase [Selenomonadales bacterium OttesenSCG-928-I06]|nr:3-deoxy-8-phosphooctulonate synthase [Selenomonadales bacterium OttesenSCG-928-I06]